MSKPKIIARNASRKAFLTGILVPMIAMAVFVSRVAAQDVSSHHHADASSDSVNSNPETTQDWARDRLSKSPRHREWVKVKNGNREVNSFVVYPEVNSKATAVLVIHEIFGMSDWVQQLTDELAEAGYIAIAPDLLSGMGPKGGGTSDFDGNAVRQAIDALPPDQITGDLNAVADYVSNLPGANSKVVVAGFCWGGSQAFNFATNRPSLKAAFVFYGTPPANNQQGRPFAIDKSAVARVSAPVYGFYAEKDMRVDATIPPAVDAMQELKKTYDPVTYAGAGHGFMRAGEPNDPPPIAPVTKSNPTAEKKDADDYQNALAMYNANRKASDDAWVRWRAILAKL